MCHVVWKGLKLGQIESSHPDYDGWLAAVRNLSWPEGRDYSSVAK